MTPKYIEKHLERHRDWVLIEYLEQHRDPMCHEASKLIRELKLDLAKAEDKASRLRWPDTTGQ